MSARIGVDDDGIDWIERDILADELKARRYRQRLRAHPDCRDPDHPGCMWCEPEDFLDPDEEPLSGAAETLSD